MVRLLIRIACNLGSAALGIVVAAALLDGFTFSWRGFVVAVVVFVLVQIILTPAIFKLTAKHASRLMGGAGIVATLLALWVATWFDGGISISGVGAWIAGALIVWVVFALGGWLLPLALLRKRRQAAQGAA